MRARWLFALAACLWLAALARDAGDRWVAATLLPPLVPDSSVEVLDRNGVLLRAFQAPNITRKPGIKIIAQMILSKLAFTHGKLPKKYPAVQIPSTQISAPATLKNVNLRRSIAPTPATNGAKVRKNGMKRATMMVMPP